MRAILAILLGGLLLWAQALAVLAPPAPTQPSCSCCASVRCTCCLDRSESDRVPLSAAVLVSSSQVGLADLLTAGSAAPQVLAAPTAELPPRPSSDAASTVPVYRRHCALLL